MKERVQKILAGAGVASLRKCEEFIREARVKVNDVAVKLGDRADNLQDRITFDGKPVKPSAKVYFILNKPKGYISSAKDHHGRRTVIELVKSFERIYPVGRLDFNVEGLLILTNDGELANKIMHPHYGVAKTYQAVLDKGLNSGDLERLKNLVVDNKHVEIRNIKVEGCTVTLTLHEGRKHIVKKIFKMLGKRVCSLRRVSIGSLALGNLRPGRCKKVSREFLVKHIFGV